MSSFPVYLRLFLNEMPFGAALVDYNFTVFQANSLFSRILKNNGLKDKEQILDWLKFAVLNNPSKKDKVTIDYQEKRFYAIADSTVRINRQKYRIIYFSDITKCYFQQERQQRVYEFNLLETIAANIADEIGNSLMVIKGCSQLMAERQQDIPDLSYLITREADRVNATVSTLLNAVQRQSFSLETINLVELIKSSVFSILAKISRKQVDFTFSVPTEDVLVQANPYRLQQVICYLTDNALDALTNKGRFQLLLKRHNNSSEIIFEDDGKQVPGAYQEIFQPFFTTKSGHIGLGLSICKRILEACGGTLDMEISPSSTKKFVVKLPLSQKA